VSGRKDIASTAYFWTEKVGNPPTRSCERETGPLSMMAVCLETNTHYTNDDYDDYIAEHV